MARIALLLLFAPTVLSPGAKAQDEAIHPKTPTAQVKRNATVASSYTLVIVCDLECFWFLDGAQKGHLAAGTSVKLGVEKGSHLVHAQTVDSLDHYGETLDIEKQGQTLVEVTLAGRRRQRIEAAASQQLYADAQQRSRDTAAELERQELAKSPFDRAMERYQKKKYGDALPFFESACNEGKLAGCAYAGRIYEKPSDLRGSDVEEDDFKAVALYKKGCGRDDAQSCNGLGSMVDDGNGVSLDHVRAANLFLKSCNAGFAEACTNLGLMYEGDDGIQKDLQRAEHYYRKGCDGGDSGGCDGLKDLKKE